MPAPKVTEEIARTRGIPIGQTCESPAGHAEFSTPTELLEFSGRLKSLSGGKPVGVKLCIGHPWEFVALVKAMVETGEVLDFITIDGSEGGTGAAPTEFSDHIGSPLRDAIVFVDNALRGAGLRERVKIGASAKIVSAYDITRVCALGADWCNMARPFMFALGCIKRKIVGQGIVRQESQPWILSGIEPLIFHRVLNEYETSISTPSRQLPNCWEQLEFLIQKT